MDTRTRLALHSSISRWKKKLRRAPEELDFGPATCPLCQQFFKHGCGGCPVFEKTDQVACRDTPYQKVIDSHHAYVYHAYVCSDSPSESLLIDLREKIQEEITFLESLLPQSETTSS